MPGNTDMASLIMRLGIGSLMLTHGLPKFAKLFADEPIVFASVFGMSQPVSLGLAVFAEVLCSLMIILGIGTRLAIIPLAITMAVAAFYIHGADPFAKQEMAILYLVGLVALFIVGPGKYSVDNLMIKKESLR